MPAGARHQAGDEPTVLAADQDHAAPGGGAEGLGQGHHVHPDVVEPQLQLEPTADDPQEAGLLGDHAAEGDLPAQTHARRDLRQLLALHEEEVEVRGDVEVEAVVRDGHHAHRDHAPARERVDVARELAAVDLAVDDVQRGERGAAPHAEARPPGVGGQAVRLLGDAQGARDGGGRAAGERVLVVAEVRLELGHAAAGGEVPLDGVEPRVGARGLRGGLARHALDAVQATLDAAQLRVPSARGPADGLVHLALAHAGAGGRDHLRGLVAVARAERQLVLADRAVEHLAARRLALAVRVQVRGGLGADEGVAAARHRVAAHRDERAVAALAHGDAAHDLEVLAGPAGGARAVEAVAAVGAPPGHAGLGGAEASGVRVDQTRVGAHGGGLGALVDAVGDAVDVAVDVERHALRKDVGAEGEEEGERQDAHAADGEGVAVHAFLDWFRLQRRTVGWGCSGGHPGSRLDALAGVTTGRIAGLFAFGGESEIGACASYLLPENLASEKPHFLARASPIL